MKRIVLNVTVAVLTFCIAVSSTSMIRRLGISDAPEALLGSQLGWWKLLNAAREPIIPSDWKRIELSRFFFYVPPNIDRQFMHSVDSEVWHAEYSTMRLACDYGEYSTDLHAYANQPEYNAEWYLIGGKAAKVETLHITNRATDWLDKDRGYHASVYFPDVGNGRAKLDCRADSMDSSVRETAKTVFLSIRFK